jgi:hypothetical protein
MKIRLFALSLMIAMTAVLACAQGADDGFQPARVVAFERVAADAQHMENSDRYKISMRIGDTVYACRASGPASTFVDWSGGKEFPTRMNGKTLQVKSPSGDIVELTITGKKTAK